MFHATKYVINRSGERKKMSLDAIQDRISAQCCKVPVLENLSPLEITVKTVESLHDNISTSEIDKITAKLCYERADIESDYETLACRIMVSDNHKNVPDSMCEAVNKLSKLNPTIYATWFVKLLNKHSDKIDAMIDHSRDSLFDFMGYMTINKSYLLIHKDVIHERAQHMWMRCAVECYRDDFDKVKRMYESLSTMQYIHATPTLFNSGLHNNQLSSCMLVSNREDSIEGIFTTYKEIAKLASRAGGIGFNVGNVRSKGMKISSTGRDSDGAQRFLRLYEELGNVITQGGKRKASMACYIEVWMDEIVDIMELMSVECEVDGRLRNLFFAIWSNDLFAERCINDEMWTMFSPNQTPELWDTYGDEFRIHYERYEQDESIRKTTISARDLMVKIAKNIGELGYPYYLNKDQCCAKSNMTDIAVCHSSNLCAEIIIPSGDIDGEHEIGVCTLASINLKKFLKIKEPLYYECAPLTGPVGEYIDLLRLSEVSYEICENLNKIIDQQHYPCLAAQRSSERHRPIGIGIQGYSDICILLGIEYDSKFGRELTFRTAEAIQFGAQRASVDLARNIQLNIKTNFEESLEVLADKLEKSMGEYYENIEEQNLSINMLRNAKDVLNAVHKPIIGVCDTILKYGKIKEVKRNTTVSSLIQNIDELLESFGNNEFIFDDLNDLNDASQICLVVSLLIKGLRKQHGAYPSCSETSYVRQGKFQHDLWGKLPYKINKCFNWEKLRKDMMKFGQRNAFLTAYMPTASTSNILGNYPSFEALSTNIYMVNALAGTFKRPNRYLIDYMKHHGLWNEDSIQRIIDADGDVSEFEDLPIVVRGVFRTAWQIKNKSMMKLASIRAPFICQTQSLNMYMDTPTIGNITNMLLHGHKLKLKTIIYYLRTKRANKTDKVSGELIIANKKDDKEDKNHEQAQIACSRANPDNCIMCSS